MTELMEDLDAMEDLCGRMERQAAAERPYRSLHTITLLAVCRVLYRMLKREARRERHEQ